MTAICSPRIAGAGKRFVNDLPVLLLSIVIQLLLALLFGHFYDMRIFMATGYMVATGQNPYAPQDLTSVFNNRAFQAMTTVGYPPPWPLVLGLIYRGVYTVCPNFLVYNLAVKIPIIAANIGIAYLVAGILNNLGADATASRRAWIFLLLNPYLLYASSAWGQFDSIVALLSLLSLVLLQAGNRTGSALSLALAISFKPTALPIFPVALIYLWGKSLRQAVSYSIGFLAGIVLFCVAPFILFGWDPSPIFHGWNAHFTVGGGMAWLTFIELLKDSYVLPGMWWLLGLVWVPALGIAILILALTPGMAGFVDLLRKSTALILVFFLTRTWLSEPNVILLLPLVVILTSLGELKRLLLFAVWILPLVFTIFNASPPQLLFPAFPDAMGSILKRMDDFRTARLLIRTALVIPWQIAGWWMVISLFKEHSAPSNMG